MDSLRYHAHINVTCHSAHGRLFFKAYLFTGVRPSSGAETGDWHRAQINPSALNHAELAATEDGRTPLT